MKMFQKQLSSCFALLVCLIIGCGGGSSPDTPPIENPPPALPIIFTGVYIDSAVEGLNYTTESQTGTTNFLGEFSYLAGENIVFSIGDIEFPSVTASEMLTPLDIFNTTDYSHVGVVNMARLLQSLDTDGAADNGIAISNDVHSAATGLTVDFEDVDFDNIVGTLVANSGNVYVELIDETQAISHLQMSLGDSMATGCGNDHPMVGFSGNFSTLAHNVSGTATIINNCTIRVTEFNYDGGGPQVYFYAANNFMFDSSDAFAIGGAINGQTYTNRTLDYDLPDGKTLDDFDTLSVWCVDFNANFGELIFTAP